MADKIKLKDFSLELIPTSKNVVEFIGKSLPKLNPARRFMISSVLEQDTFISYKEGHGELAVQDPTLLIQKISIYDVNCPNDNTSYDIGIYKIDLSNGLSKLAWCYGSSDGVEELFLDGTNGFFIQSDSVLTEEQILLKWFIDDYEEYYEELDDDNE